MGALNPVFATKGILSSSLLQVVATRNRAAGLSNGVKSFPMESAHYGFNNMEISFLKFF